MTTLPTFEAIEQHVNHYIDLLDLECLDHADRASLQAALMPTGIDASDFLLLLFRRLKSWLQDWTESTEENLDVLLELVRTMSGSRPKQKVNWIEDGF